jgi:hypothetical protein
MLSITRAPTTRLTLRRPGWFLLGALVTAFAIFEVVKHGLGLGPILVFALLPDLAMLAGIGQPHQKGQMPARAVPLYNLTHNPLLPISLLVVVSLGIFKPLDLFWFVGGLTWLAHIAFDRALGYGPRTPDGWQRG